jgi:hypothetical protein
MLLSLAASALKASRRAAPARHELGLHEAIAGVSECRAEAQTFRVGVGVALRSGTMLHDCVVALDTRGHSVGLLAG